MIKFGKLFLVYFYRVFNFFFWKFEREERGPVRLKERKLVDEIGGKN